MKTWKFSVASLVGSGIATAREAVDRRHSSSAGSRRRLVRIRPPRSGKRSDGNVSLFHSPLSTPRPLFVEEFFEYFTARRVDPDGPGDVLSQVGVDQPDRVLPGGQQQRGIERSDPDL